MLPPDVYSRRHSLDEVVALLRAHTLEQFWLRVQPLQFANSAGRHFKVFFPHNPAHFAYRTTTVAAFCDNPNPFLEAWEGDLKLTDGTDLVAIVHREPEPAC